MYQGSRSCSRTRNDFAILGAGRKTTGVHFYFSFYEEAANAIKNDMTPYSEVYRNQFASRSLLYLPPTLKQVAATTSLSQKINASKLLQNLPLEFVTYLFNVWTINPLRPETDKRTQIQR